MSLNHHHQVAKRSASHGALNSAYAGDGRAGFDPASSLPSFRRPLRSVKENMAFLQSPGPLESMLKTTTETGDIGIFSTMKPSPTLPNFPGNQSIIQDMQSVRRPWSRASDRSLPRDDRRHLPSYRDSASEIISMYGSDSHRSVSSSFAPALEEAAYRSYSMTSCGPKSAHTYRSDGYLQVNSPVNGLQRPRSPFPYPTRLKRPGVRPSSPALTENGSVDYSRMVEIDRVSYRTVHGSYKSMYPRQHPRRPLPLSLRATANHSRPALPAYLDELRKRSPSVASSCRSHPVDYGTWTDRYRNGLARLGSSSDQSLRTGSLTSTASGYQNDLLPPSRQVSTAKRSFYYDYSEEFEETRDDTIMPLIPIPLAPIPTRASNVYRPMVLQDDCDARLDIRTQESHMRPLDYLGRRVMTESPRQNTQTQKDSHSQAARIGMSDNGTSREQYLTHKSVLPHRECQVVQGRAGEVPAIITVSPQSPGDDRSADQIGARISEESDDTLRTVGAGTLGNSPDDNVAPTLADLQEARVKRGADIRSIREGLFEPRLEANVPPALSHPDKKPERPPTSQDVRKSQQHSESATALKDAGDAQHMRPSQTMHDEARASRLYSLDPELRDLASFVKCVDRAIKTPMMQDSDSVRATSRVDMGQCHTTPPYTVVSSESGSSEEAGVAGEQQASEATSTKPLVLVHRHRRNHAVLGINPGTIHDDTAEPCLAALARTETPMLAPQPISPARELRVKNSIPQLMKALPPLPAYPPTPESPGAAAVPANLNHFDLSRLTEAHSTLIDDMEHDGRGPDDVPKHHRNRNPFRFDGEIAKPRLKLRPGPAQGLGTPHRIQGSVSRHDERFPSRKRPRYAPPKHEFHSGYEHTTYFKPRLKVKVSRGALSSKSSDDTGTVKRHITVEKSSTFADIASQNQKNLFTPSAALDAVTKHEDGVQKPGNGPQQPTETKDDSAIDRPSTPKARLQGLSNKRGSSLDAHLDSMRLPGMSLDPITPGMRSFFSQGSDLIPRDLLPPRGVRKRLSDLRARLAETRPPQAEFPVLDAGFSDDAEKTKIAAAATTPVLFSGDSGDVLASKRKDSPEQQPAQRGKLKRKISRWMKDATHAVRAYVKKKQKTQG